MLTKRGWSRLAALAGLWVVSGVALGAIAYDPDQWNMPVGVTELSREVHRLHMIIFYVCCAIGVLVFGAMFYSLFAHRRSKHPKPADFHESTSIEILWTVIPFAILIAMAVPAAGTLIRMEDMRGSELSVKVTGFQWKWQYEYMNEGVTFFSTLHADSNRARQLDSGIDPNSIPNYLLEVDNRLVVPTGVKIRFVITANDVIHAWWVPDLAVKKDAVPGYVNEMWALIEQPGIYRGVCAELCGRDHGFMPVVVEAVAPEAFKQWLADTKAGKVTTLGHGPAPAQVASAAAPVPAEVTAAPDAAPDAAPAPKPTDVAAAPAASGEKVYNTQCAACHQATGQGMPPTFPALAGSKVANGPADAHIQQTLKGKGAMPPFATMSDADLAAAISFERTSWGNKGGAVSAEQVKAQRGK